MYSTLRIIINHRVNHFTRIWKKVLPRCSQCCAQFSAFAHLAYSYTAMWIYLCKYWTRIRIRPFFVGMTAILYVLRVPTYLTREYASNTRTDGHWTWARAKEESRLHLSTWTRTLATTSSWGKLHLWIACFVYCTCILYMYSYSIIRNCATSSR